MDGISSLSIGVVFHQLGAPRREIFSSVESFFRRSSTSASRNERDIGMVSSSLKLMDLFSMRRVEGTFWGNDVGKEGALEMRTGPHYYMSALGLTPGYIVNECRQ